MNDLFIHTFFVFSLQTLIGENFLSGFYITFTEYEREPNCGYYYFLNLGFVEMGLLDLVNGLLITFVGILRLGNGKVT